MQVIGYYLYNIFFLKSREKTEHDTPEKMILTEYKLKQTDIFLLLFREKRKLI